MKETMDIGDQKLLRTILQEIDSRLNEGGHSLRNDDLSHLADEGEVLEYLLYLRAKGLISGALVSRGADHTPHRVVNIRLTYIGMKALKAQPN
jgi:hypothetical protein